MPAYKKRAISGRTSAYSNEVLRESERRMWEYVPKEITRIRCQLRKKPRREFPPPPRAEEWGGRARASERFGATAKISKK